MKYTLEIDIDLPREKVIELFDNTDNMFKWMEGLVGFEHLSGEAGQEGAKSRLKYEMGKRKIEMIETITKRNLPDEFTLTYDAKGVWNEVVNRFVEVSPDKTKWITDQEFKFSGIMKVIGALMPGSFKKQSYKYLEMFKDFAEKEAASGGK